jgi:hypothetical protein
MPYGQRVSVPCRNPNKENQVPLFMTPGERVAQLCP